MSRTLVITGGSRGIGLATCVHFAGRDYRVINLSRRPAPVDGAVNIAVDLSEPDWTERLGHTLLDALDGNREITLIHNAGLTVNDTVENLDPATLRRMLQINLIAPAQLNKLLLPRLGNGSSILYVGSTLSEKAVAGSCSYVISKHGLVGLMRATCQDLAGRGIHTACICPGFTDTAMLREHMDGGEAALQSIASAVTFNRLIEPGEIAATLYFCARNPVINGAVIHANLGQVER